MILFVVLALANIIPLFIIRTSNRFWIISIPLWIFMIAGFISWRISSAKETEGLQIAYNKTIGNQGYGDASKWNALEDFEKSKVTANRKMLNQIFFQTFMMWILQMIGLRKTKNDYYFWLSWITGILFLVAFILEALMGIVPTGPLINRN
jgi:hypothetical protein